MTLYHSFDVVEPISLPEALGFLKPNDPTRQVVAGGTDLLRDIRLGSKQPALLISLDKIPLLGTLQELPSGGFSIGPAVSMGRLASHVRLRSQATALSEAASWMGSPQVRNRATFGGNLCNARPCADTAPPACVLDAELKLQSLSGFRTVKAADFMVGPGKTVRKPEEILVEIMLPKLPEKSGSCFLTVTNRKAVEITITSVAVRISFQAMKGPITTAKICLGSVGPTPIRAVRAEGELLGQLPTSQVFQKAAQAAVADASPIDDFRATAAYRNWMVELLTQRALQIALKRAQGEGL